MDVILLLGIIGMSFLLITDIDGVGISNIAKVGGVGFIIKLFMDNIRFLNSKDKKDE
jgi:hypothetical protein